jgi:serine phosphatase RsbU (regulator of sigma subunit)/DNA-binding response OmpR family regulator
MTALTPLPLLDALGREPTVLVVDDSPENRYTVRRTLTRAGFVVFEAETGAEGLERALDDPDVIILDVNLPDIDGFEVCRRLRNDPRIAHIPVVHLSQSRVGDASRVFGLESGADAYLTDPVAPAVLVATTNALLRMRRAEDALRRRAADAELLATLNAALADALTGQQVTEELFGHSLLRLGAQDVTVYLTDRTSRRLKPAYSAGTDDGVAAYEDVDDDELLEATFKTGSPRFESERDACGWAVLPLIAYGHCIGVLRITFAPAVTLTDELRDLVLAVGERGAQALERAQLYEDERAIATTLQASLLPATLPDIPHIELGVRYAAGFRGMLVGGDFYDFAARPDDWIVVIGDACGQGAAAAALTSLARHTVRAVAPYVSSPAAILRVVHDAVEAETREGAVTFLTAICLQLRPAASGTTGTLAIGGHPKPLLVDADGRVEAIGRSGRLLGVIAPGTHPETEFTLAPGAMLVLYTDGVTEARRGTDLFGDERLLETVSALARAGASAQDVADGILDACTRHAENPADDIAVLVLRAR